VTRGTPAVTGTVRTRAPVFYGWLVVAAAFTVCWLGFGSAYTFSAFLGSLQNDFGASRGSVSLVFSLAGFLYFGLGVITDRWGARRFAVLGMLLTGAGLVCAGLARSLTEVYSAYGLGVGLGIGCAYVPAVSAVQRWFVKRRGFASGLAVSGIGVGTLVMPPLAGHLIALLGWRHAYVALGIVVALAGAGFSMLIENDPHDRGLHPDNDPSQTQRPSAAGSTVPAAVGSLRFIGLYCACLSASVGMFVPFVHLAPYAVDHGVSQSQALLLVSIIGIGSTAGRFLLGGLADRMGRRPALLAMFLGIAAADAIWMLSGSFAPLAVFGFAYGVFYGGYVALLPALVMDYFGGRNIGSLIGILYTSVAVGTLIGPTAVGYAFDRSHSYTVPIFASVCGSLLAACIMAATSAAPAPFRTRTAGESPRET